MNVVQFGNAMCILAPHGRGGLIGFIKDTSYSFQKVNSGGKDWYQVRVNNKSSYQDCDEGAFRIFFE